MSADSISEMAGRGTADVVPPHVLIVDDTDMNLTLLSQLLRAEGRISTASSGAEALAIMRQDPPDLVLLDIDMPEMDGREVLRLMFADPALKDIPTIFVTGLDSVDDQVAGLALGAVDYICKPFRAKIVKARVRTQLKIRQYAQSLLRANEELDYLVRRDPLTGAYNRRHFFEVLESEFLRTQRYRNPCSVLILDIDHFKSINDTYGHDLGDAALIALCKCMDQVLRCQDTFARLGGEEFAVLLPETPGDKAIIAAERVLQAVREIRIAAGDGEFGFTVSVGMAAICSSDAKTDAIMVRADQALYRAKGSGRDRLNVSASPNAAQRKVAAVA